MSKVSALMIAAMVAATTLPAFAAEPSPTPAPAKKITKTVQVKKSKVKAVSTKKHAESKEAAKKETK